MKRKLLQLIGKHLKDVIKTKTSPDSIAIGFAIGSFIAITPTPGFGVLIGVLILLIFKKVSKIALFAGMALFNPIFIIPLHILSFKIGSLFFGAAPVVEYKLSILDQVFAFTRRYLVGNLIIASGISIISYYSLRYSLKKHYLKN